MSADCGRLAVKKKAYWLNQIFVILQVYRDTEAVVPLNSRQFCTCSAIYSAKKKTKEKFNAYALNIEKNKLNTLVQ